MYPQQQLSEIPREVAPRCGACGSERRSTFYEPGDIVECLSCGLLYVSPRPTAAAITAFYSTLNHYDLWDEQPGRKALWARRVERIRSLVPGGLLLDIGAGQGDFGANARKVYEVDGTEVSAEGQRLALERHGLTLRLGDASAIDLPKNHYDVVTLWHVLEHVAEPGKLLARCHSLLKPGGVLCVAVPNTQRAPKSTYGALRAGIEAAFTPRTRRKAPFSRLQLIDANEEIHLTHFNLSTLVASLQRCGFTLVTAGLDDHSADNRWQARVQHFWHAFLFRAFGLVLAPAIFAAGRK